jgi:hypothetical protein
VTDGLKQTLVDLISNEEKRITGHGEDLYEKYDTAAENLDCFIKELNEEIAYLLRSYAVLNTDCPTP